MKVEASKPAADPQQTLDFPFGSPKLDSLSELLEANKPTPPEAKAPPKAQPAPEKPASPPPAASKPEADKPGTLSDWMRGDATPSKPQAPPTADENQQAATARPEKSPGAKTVSESSRKTQPSLESLLSSFRDSSSVGGPAGSAPAKAAAADEPAPAAAKPDPPKPAQPAASEAKPTQPAAPKPMQPPAAKAEPPQTQPQPQPQTQPSSTNQPTAAFQRPAVALNQGPPQGPPRVPQPAAPRPVAGAAPVQPTQPPAAKASPQPTPPRPADKPTKFEDLSVERLAGQAAPPPQPRAAEPAEQPHRARPLPESELGRSNNRYGRSSGRLRSLAVVTAGAAVGLGLGYLGLLWVAGPSGDMLGVAQVLPSAVLPSSFAADEPQRLESLPAEEDLPTNSEASDPVARTPQEDTNVAPAGYEGTQIVPQAQVASFERTEQRESLGVARLAGAPDPYSVDQLAGVLVGSDDARRTMTEKSLAATPEAARELGSAYGKLCQVAQVLTFTRDATGSQELTVLQAKELFIRVFDSGHARSDSCAMASRWLAWSQRASGGVFFAGDLVAAAKSGEVFEYSMRLSPTELVTVLSDEPIDHNRFRGKDQMGVVGCVIEDPASRVQGYTGDAERAVWACHTIPLGKPRLD